LFSANGLAQLLDTIDSVRRHYNPLLSVAGLVFNQHERTTVSGKTWIETVSDVAAARGLPVLLPPIPKKVVISDAAEAARGLDEWGTAEASALNMLYVDHLAAIEGARV
jgi:chromosome partitioning protein